LNQQDFSQILVNPTETDQEILYCVGMLLNFMKEKKKQAYI
jgi:hypothetical protein